MKANKNQNYGPYAPVNPPFVEPDATRGAFFKLSQRKRRKLKRMGGK